jgi:hypothetical protein
VPYYDLMGLDAITTERVRQINKEGFTAGHDDNHMRGELALAAKCYLVAGMIAETGAPAGELSKPADWPWDAEWWKPSNNPTANLVKAGALIAAEIDRLERVAQNLTGRGPGGGRSIAGL